MVFNITEIATGFNTSRFMTFGEFCTRDIFQELSDGAIWDKFLAKYGEKRFLCPIERSFKLILRNNATHKVDEKGLM